MIKEVYRQFIHIGVALTLIILLMDFGRTETLFALFIGILLGSIVINLKFLNKKLPVIDTLVNSFERKNVRFVGYGSAWLAIGCMLTVASLSSMSEIMAILWILGIGDGLATIVGISGEIKLPYNKNKTLEGSLAMFFSSLFAYVFIGPQVVLIAFLATLIESLDLPIDDNVMIPFLGIVLFEMVM